jgi:hypothetical protein
VAEIVEAISSSEYAIDDRLSRLRWIPRDALAQVGLYAQDLQAVDGILRPSAPATRAEREARFISLPQEWESSADPVAQHFATMMSGFEPGLFVGDEMAELPVDN